MSFPRYPAYKDSGVEWLGKVPCNWQGWRLSHAFGVIGSGTTPPSNEPQWYEEGATPWVTTSELREVVITETVKSITDDALRKFSALRIYPAGSLVIAMYGATIGRLGILGVAATTNQACCVLCQPQHLQIRFCFYWFQGFRENLVAWYATGGGQPNINQQILAELLIPAPSLGEQAAIAAFLDCETAKIDALVADYRALIELLQEKRQAVISHAVTKGLDPTVPMKDSGVEWLGEVPEHWEVGSVRRFSASVETGSTPLTYKPLDEGDGVMNWFTPGDFDGSVVLSRVAKRLSKAALEAREAPVFPANCVLVVSIGATLGKVGYCGVECSANQQINAVIPGYNLSGQFLAYALCSRVDSMRVLSNASTIGIMNQEKTKAVPLVKPPLAEQIDIVRFLDMQSDRVDSLINDAKDAITLLQERRTALISAAVTGKIDVRGLVEPEAT